LPCKDAGRYRSGRTTGYGIEIDHDTVVLFTTNEAYALFDDSATRKHILGEAAKLVFERFIARLDQALSDLRVLAQTAAEGHILVHSDHPAVQESMSSVSIGGAFQAGPDEFLAVVVNSAAGSKLDYYQERDLLLGATRRRSNGSYDDYDFVVESRPHEWATSNRHRPLLSLARIVDASVRSCGICNLPRACLVNTYCAEGSVPSGVTLNGESVSASAMSIWRPVRPHVLSIPAGERAELMVSSLWPDVVRFLSQPVISFWRAQRIARERWSLDDRAATSWTSLPTRRDKDAPR
jgi:hypothetical protein